MAVAPQLDEWQGTDVALADVERELALLRQSSVESGAGLRTSVMTHLAWVPEAWVAAASSTLEGLAERHPSRTILLVPQPEAGEDGLDARVAVRRFPMGDAQRNVCSEVVELRMRGRRTRAPASIVAPLLIPDLPVFLRWRGEPPFGGVEFEQ